MTMARLTQEELMAYSTPNYSTSTSNYSISNYVKEPVVVGNHGKLGTGYGWTWHRDDAIPDYEVEYEPETMHAVCSRKTWEWLNQNSGRHTVVNEVMKAKEMAKSKMRMSYSHLEARTVEDRVGIALETLTGEMVSLIQAAAVGNQSDVQTEVIIKRYGRLKDEIQSLRAGVDNLESMLVVLDDTIQEKVGVRDAG